jgi:hypothetical protein
MARGRAPQRRPTPTRLPDGSPARQLTADEVFVVVAYAAGVRPVSTTALAGRVEAAYPDWNQDTAQLSNLLASLVSDNRVTKVDQPDQPDLVDQVDQPGARRRVSYWQLAAGLAHPPIGEPEIHA